MKKQKRAAVVFAGLISALTVTSALLLAVAPAPLKPDAAAMAGDAVFLPLDGIFKTAAAVTGDRWEYIYIRHSRTAPGDSRQIGSGSAGDHFVVTSRGVSSPASADGQVQMTPRWVQQQSAAAPQGAASIHPRCISIVLIGDFDKTVPTPAQLARTTQLVRTLQQRLGVPTDKVLMIDQANSQAGTGRFFPSSAFKDTLAK